MKNRISHLLQSWNPDLLASGLTDSGEAPVQDRALRGPTQMPRGVNMLMPVELCVNRNLMVSLLSASIVEMNRHKRSHPPALSSRDLAEMEAALQQQVAFRSWLKEHPSSYVCVALYPVSEAGNVEDLEDLGDLPS